MLTICEFPETLSIPLVLPRLVVPPLRVIAFPPRVYDGADPSNIMLFTTAFEILLFGVVRDENENVSGTGNSGTRSLSQFRGSFQLSVVALVPSQMLSANNELIGSKNNATASGAKIAAARSDLDMENIPQEDASFRATPVRASTSAKEPPESASGPALTPKISAAQRVKTDSSVIVIDYNRSNCSLCAIEKRSRRR